MMIRAKPEVKYKLIQEMTSRDNNLLNITWLCDAIILKKREPRRIR